MVIFDEEDFREQANDVLSKVLTREEIYVDDYFQTDPPDIDVRGDDDRIIEGIIYYDVIVDKEKNISFGISIVASSGRVILPKSFVFNGTTYPLTKSNVNKFVIQRWMKNEQTN